MICILFHFFAAMSLYCTTGRLHKHAAVALTHSSCCALNVHFETPVRLAVKLIHQTLHDLEMKAGGSHLHTDLYNCPLPN